MRKTITLALTAALAFALVGPADAKKKKPKKPPAATPVEVQYFLRTEESCEAPFLSLTDGEDPSDCFFGIDDMFNEYPQLQGNAVFGEGTDHYTASEGLPLKLDASRKVTGTMTIRGYNPTVNGQGVIMWGIGEAEVDITLKATIAGAEKEIGTLNHAYTAGPNHLEKVDFEFTIDPSLNGAVVEGLTLDVRTHGTVIFGRGIEHDAEVPPSIKIPAFQ